MGTPKVWTRAPGRHELGRLFRYCQRRAARSGGTFLYLVPNQGLLRVRGAGNVARRGRLMTLQAFGEEVVRAAYPEGIFLDDGDRWVIVARVTDSLLAAGALPYTGKIAREPGFIAGVAAAIGELKEASISPDRFRPRGALEEEFARIYAGYEEALAERNLLDGAGLMAAAARALASGAALPVLDGVTVAAAEGFFALTPLQRQLMEALAGRLPEVWVEVMAEDGEPLFAPIRRAVEGWQVARRSSRERPSGAAGDPLAHLELALFRQKQRPALPSGGRVRLVTGPGIAGEVGEVAQEVKRLILEEGLRPDQVALILPDRERYGQPLQQALREYGLPVRAAEPVSAYPLGRFLLDLVRLAAGDWNPSTLIRTLRAPYGGSRWLDAAAADWLEGEAYGWPLPRRPADWDGRLGGLEAELRAGAGQEGRARLAAAAREGLSRLAADLAPLGEPGPVPALCERLRALLEAISIEQQILRMGRERPSDPQALTRTARELNALHATGRALNRMSRVYGLWGDAFAARPDEFYTLLEKELDQENHRADPRPPGPAAELLGPGQAYGRRFAVVFVLGLAEGILPGAPRPDFPLPEGRRQELGLPAFADRLAREQLLFLTAATRAEARLYLAYPSPDESEEFLRSAFVDDLLALFADGPLIRPICRELSEVIPGFGRAASRQEMALAAARALGRGPEAHAGERQLAEALGTEGHLPNGPAVAHALWVAGQRNSGEYTPWEGKMAEPEAIRRLAARYSEERALSVGDAEKAALCPFRFLGERILGLAPWEPWQLREDPKEMGSLRHAILSGFWRRWAKPLTRESLPEAQQVMADLVAELAETSPAARRQKAALLRWAASWLEGEAGLAETFGGQIRPRWLELGFGRPVRQGEMDPDSTEEPLVIALEGQVFRFAGVIDRVDLGDGPDGPAIIYDYKGSGARDWAGAVAGGLNLQPMLYARAVQQLFRPGAAVAGAAYYFTNRRNKSRSDVGTGIWREDFAGKLQKRSGRLTGEEVAGRIEEAAATAARAVAGIRAGDFRVAHREPCPSWCALRFACRRFDDKGPFVKGEEPVAVPE